MDLLGIGPVVSVHANSTWLSLSIEDAFFRKKCSLNGGEIKKSLFFLLYISLILLQATVHCQHQLSYKNFMSIYLFNVYYANMR